MDNLSIYSEIMDCESNSFSFHLFKQHKGKPLIDICNSRHIAITDVTNEMKIAKFFDIQYIDIKSRLYVVATHLGIPYLDDVSEYSYSEKVLGNVEAINFFEKHVAVIVKYNNKDWLLVGSADLLNENYNAKDHFAIQSIIEEHELESLPRIVANPLQIITIINNLKVDSDSQSRTLNVTKKPCDTYDLMALARQRNVTTMHIKFNENNEFISFNMLEHERSMVRQKIEIKNPLRLYSTLNTIYMASKNSTKYYTKINNIYHSGMPSKFACNCSKITNSFGHSIFIINMFLEVDDLVQATEFDRVISYSSTNLRKQLAERLSLYKSSIVCVPPSYCLTIIEKEINNVVLANINDKGEHFIINTDNYNYTGTSQTPISISSIEDQDLLNLNSSFINLGKITRSTMPMGRVESLINNYQRIIAVTNAPKEQIPSNLKPYIINAE